jgi:hypothetical protein
MTRTTTALLLTLLASPAMALTDLEYATLKECKSRETLARTVMWRRQEGIEISGLIALIKGTDNPKKQRISPSRSLPTPTATRDS